MDGVMNTIKVVLYENLLTDDPNDLTAKVVSERTLGVKEICKTAVDRGKAPTTPEAMEHNVNLFFREMAFQLMNGFGVSTGWFTAIAQVRGVFANQMEKFDPKKHVILFRFNQGDLLRKELPKVNVQITGMGDSATVISHVVDKKTGEVNDLITPGGMLKIRGGKLKIAGDNPENGVYFQDEEGNQFKVEHRDIVTNNPSELMVEIPQLIPGKYRLIITTQHTSGGTLLKTPRTCVYDKILTVA